MVKQWLLRKLFHVDIQEYTKQVVSLESHKEYYKGKYSETARELDNLRDQVKNSPREIKTFAMTEETYQSLVKALPAAAVSSTTSDIQAGFQLGVQHTLNILRERHVV